MFAALMLMATVQVRQPVTFVRTSPHTECSVRALVQGSGLVRECYTVGGK